MKTYNVYWEVSKYAIVKANSEAEAIEKVMSEDIEQYEKEITLPPEAEEIDEKFHREAR